MLAIISFFDIKEIDSDLCDSPRTKTDVHKGQIHCHQVSPQKTWPLAVLRARALHNDDSQRDTAPNNESGIGGEAQTHVSPDPETL